MAKHKGLSFYKKKKNKISAQTLHEIIGWLFGIFVSILIAFVLTTSIGMQTSMIGVSMEPELYNGQKILVNRFIYKLSSPKRGDVIVFLPNGNQNAHYYVKRVVALPGETVQIKGGRLYVNGTIEEEEYDKMADAGIAENELTLGEGEFFVLGDNRNSSEDSRSGNLGAIPKTNIVGRAWFHMGSGKAGMGFVD